MVQGQPKLLWINEQMNEQMNQRVKAFFLEFEGANASSDVTGIGDLYAQTFMFLPAQMALRWSIKEDFLKVVPKMKVHFASLGLELKLRSRRSKSVP